MSKNHRKSNQPKTAAQLMAELRRDQSYEARLQEQEQSKRESIETYTRFAEPILKELKEVGFSVSSLGELRQSRKTYRAAIPTLIRWLPKISYEPLKEDIIRTLSVPWAKPEAAFSLIEEFKKPTDQSATGLRWAIANALEVVADEAVLEELVQLLQNPKYGRTREMLTLALGNIRNPGAVTVLMDLLDDEDVVGHAAMALGRLGASEARPRLEKLREHPKKWVRDEVRRALSKIAGRVSDQ